MTTPTITLPDAGKVPALPDNLHPIAIAARGMAARKWGVVAWSDGGEPVLFAGSLRTSVVAGRLAQTLTRAYGPDVFVVYRCTDAVTVHTMHPELPHNLVGTAPAPHRDLPGRPEVAALVVHIDALASSLHEHALAAHRRDRMHQHCPTCNSRVRLIRANVAEAMGNPCNNVWHDQHA